MGACIGTLVGSCVGSAVMTACCSACSCKCIFSPGCTNLVYVLTIMVSSLVAVSLRYGGIDLNVGFDIGISGPSVCVGNSTTCDGNAFSLSICNADNCAGYWAVYRIAFSVAGFFALMALCTACSCKTSTQIHRGFWFAKAFLLIGALVGSLFAPNTLFAYFAWVARFVAPLFLIYQVVIFIDFGYSTNDALIAKDERMDNFCGLENSGFKYHVVILVLSLLLYVGSFTAIGFMYAIWPQDCAFNPLAITTTLLLGLLNTGISVSKIAQHGSILTSGFIFAYSTWLCFTTLGALPEPTCNPSITADPNESSPDHVVMLVISCIVASGSCGYFAYRMGSRAIGSNAMTGGPSKAPAMSSEVEMTSDAPVNDKVTVAVQGEDGSSGGSAAADELLEPQSFFGYHFTMFTICMFMSMMLTNWGVEGGAAHTELTSAAEQGYNKGYASAWLQMSANWICCLLYLWTLIAPACLPDRDFS